MIPKFFSRTRQKPKEPLLPLTEKKGTRPLIPSEKIETGIISSTVNLLQTFVNPDRQTSDHPAPVPVPSLNLEQDYLRPLEDTRKSQFSHIIPWDLTRQFSGSKGGYPPLTDAQKHDISEVIQMIHAQNNPRLKELFLKNPWSYFLAGSIGKADPKSKAMVQRQLTDPSSLWYNIHEAPFGIRPTMDGLTADTIQGTVAASLGNCVEQSEENLRERIVNMLVSTARLNYPQSSENDLKNRVLLHQFGEVNTDIFNQSQQTDDQSLNHFKTSKWLFLSRLLHQETTEKGFEATARRKQDFFYDMQLKGAVLQNALLTGDKEKITQEIKAVLNDGSLYTREKRFALDIMAFHAFQNFAFSKNMDIYESPRGVSTNQMSPGGSFYKSIIDELQHEHKDNLSAVTMFEGHKEFLQKLYR